MRTRRRRSRALPQLDSCAGAGPPFRAPSHSVTRRRLRRDKEGRFIHTYVLRLPRPLQLRTSWSERVRLIKIPRHADLRATYGIQTPSSARLAY